MRKVREVFRLKHTLGKLAIDLGADFRVCHEQLSLVLELS